MRVAPPEASPETGAAVEFVGFWYRLGSVLWDALLLTLVLGGGLAALAGNDLATPHGQQLAATLVSLAVPGYALACWTIWGRTAGKWLCSQRIVASASGLRPSALRCIARLAAWPVGIVLWPLMFRDRFRRPLHDRLAGTCVIADDSMRLPGTVESQVIRPPPWESGRVSRRTVP